MNLIKGFKRFPDSPGVYIMRHKSGKILYVGKAQSLRKRIAYYFKDDGTFSPRLSSLLSQVEKIDYISTSSEEEALILECDLIKRYHPRYNISLRDDKKYPLLKITVNEDYPRVFITRTVKNDGARYFGPYPFVFPLRYTLKLIKKAFPIRSCRGDIDRKNDRPCLYFQLGECLGPCQGKIDRHNYRKIVSELCQFLEGKKDKIIKDLGEKMEALSRERKYEEAAKIRDQINILQRVIFMTELTPKYHYLPRNDEAEVALEELKRVLDLKTNPDFIQCLDVSNIRGKEAVGAVVSFKGGYPDKSGYRRFKIKMVKKIDDYAMIEEVLTRHFKRLEKEKKSFPDLLVIDGGLGHLNKALGTFKKLEITGVPVISLAKEFECIYLPGFNQPLRIPFNSPALSLLRHLRDEAHRFAHTYFSKLRKKKMSSSVLDDIPGIGLEKKRNLLKFFGSIEMIKKAEPKDLEKVKGISKHLAAQIKKIIR